MIYYRYLDLNYQSVAKKIHDYLLDNPDLIQDGYGSWRLSTNWILENILEIKNIFSPLNLDIDFIGIFVTHKEKSSIHIDNDSKPARINFPVLNCEGSITKYYKFSGQTDLKKQFNGISYQNINEENLEFVDSFKLTKAVVMRVLEPHQVCLQYNKFPRVSCTVQFKQDIEYLLEN